MEEIISFKIIVETETNKQTYREEFNNIGNADKYFESLIKKFSNNDSSDKYRSEATPG